MWLTVAQEIEKLENTPLGPEEDKNPGQVVVITGASSGIGRALSYLLVRKGFRVVGVGRRIDILKDMAKELNAGKRLAKFFPVKADIGAKYDCDWIIEKTFMKWGQIDWLICNAGYGVMGDVNRLTVSDYHRQIETNFYGVLQVLGPARRFLDLAKRPRVAIVGSMNSYFSLPGNSAYSASKFMLRALSESLREELRPKGIHVTFVVPGFVRTNIRCVDNNNEVVPGAKDPVPEWICVSPEAVAKAIYWGIRLRRRTVFVSWHARVLVFFHAVAPSLFYWIFRKTGLKVRAEPAKSVVA